MVSSLIENAIFKFLDLIGSVHKTLFHLPIFSINLIIAIFKNSFSESLFTPSST